LSLCGPTYIQAALNAAAFFCVLAEPFETPSARISAAANTNGRPRANLRVFMFSSLLCRKTVPGDSNLTAGRRLVGPFREPGDRAGEHVDGQFDVLGRGLFLRRMADPTVQAADEEHGRRNACARQDGGVVAGTRRELDHRKAALLELRPERRHRTLGHRDRLHPEVGLELELG